MTYFLDGYFIDKAFLQRYVGPAALLYTYDAAYSLAFPRGWLDELTRQQATNLAVASGRYAVRDFSLLKADEVS